MSLLSVYLPSSRPDSQVLFLFQPPGIPGPMHGDPTNQAGPTARQLLQMREHVHQHAQHGAPDLIEEGGAGADTRNTALQREDRERSPFDVQRTVAANATNTREVPKYRSFEIR